MTISMKMILGIAAVASAIDYRGADPSIPDYTGNGASTGIELSHADKLKRRRKNKMARKSRKKNRL